MIGLIDAILAVVIAVGLPIHAVVTYRRFLGRLTKDAPDARFREYRNMSVAMLLVAIAVMVGWSQPQRSLTLIGFHLPSGNPLWLALGLVAVIAVATWAHIRRIVCDDDTRVAAANQVASVAEVMPRTTRERRMYTILLVVTAVCEEVLYRGVLFWYFQRLFGGNLYVAVAITAFVFAFRFLHLGGPGLWRGFLAGVALAAVYHFTGSLYAVMAVRVMMELHSLFVFNAASGLFRDPANHLE